jgi:hypothetical protein
MEKIKYSKQDIDDVKARIKSVEDILKSKSCCMPAELKRTRDFLKKQLSDIRNGYMRYIAAATLRKKAGAFVDRYSESVELQDNDDYMDNYIYAKSDADALKQLNNSMLAYERLSLDGSGINNRYILWKSSDRSKPIGEAHTRFFASATHSQKGT